MERSILSTDKGLIKLLEERKEIMKQFDKYSKQADKITKEFEGINEERQKLSIKMQKVKDRVATLVEPMEDDLGEDEVIQEVKLSDSKKTAEVTILNVRIREHKLADERVDKMFKDLEESEKEGEEATEEEEKEEPKEE